MGDGVCNPYMGYHAFDVFIRDNRYICPACGDLGPVTCSTTETGAAPPQGKEG